MEAVAHEAGLSSEDSWCCGWVACREAHGEMGLGRPTGR